MYTLYDSLLCNANTERLDVYVPELQKRTKTLYFISDAIIVTVGSHISPNSRFKVLLSCWVGSKSVDWNTECGSVELRNEICFTSKQKRLPFLSKHINSKKKKKIQKIHPFMSSTVASNLLYLFYMSMLFWTAHLYRKTQNRFDKVYIECIQIKITLFRQKYTPTIGKCTGVITWPCCY